MPRGPAVLPVRRRRPELDGVRGIAIVLVVLSHGWTLWPLAPLRAAAPLDGLFHAGNVAVTVFLVIGGFAVTRSLLERAEQPGGIKPLWYLLERLVRVGTQLYAVLLAILVEQLVEAGHPYSLKSTLQSVAAAATHTYNWFVENNPLAARGDMGHLWFLSVSEQFYVALTFVLALFLRRHRTAVTVGVVVVLVLVTIWRAHSFHTENFLRSSVRTTTRMDGLLYGTLAALLLDRFEVIRVRATALMTSALIVMAAVVLSTARFGDDQYYTVVGAMMDVATTVFVLSVYHSGGPSRARATLTWSPLVRLGAMSLAIYVWHFPLFWLVARHTVTWGWFSKTALAFALLTGVVYLAQRYLDPPTRRLVAVLAQRQRRPRHDRPLDPPSCATGSPEPLEPAPQPVQPLQESHRSVV